MNPAVYDATIREITEIANGVSEYEPYVTRAIGNSRSCDELSTIVGHVNIRFGAAHSRLTEISTKITADVTAHQTTIAAQIAVLEPMMVAPTNLVELIAWAANVVEMFAGPQATLVAQNAELDVQLARVTTAITPALDGLTAAVLAINASINSQKVSLGCGAIASVEI